MRTKLCQVLQIICAIVLDKIEDEDSSILLLFVTQKGFIICHYKIPENSKEREN